ncbi:MAG: bifunctional diaminohydroxyphosphoribosylaminopyrimidine deaminase/5-amino-6-(5-phosphoribosylamino)uracil reductase RibD, partial [Lachnospirales bacterium]
MLVMNYMLRALELAKLGSGLVSPNPLVGAVIVKDDKIIGEGYHQKYGSNHAEVNAFNDARIKGNNVEGADMYVSLEPCSHFGHTPPCAKAIIEHKIKRVYVGLKDPNPKVSGSGIKMLRDAGIEVIEDYFEDDCSNNNQIFLKYITTKLPYVVMKYAMTIDGKISAYTGDSKWVTSENSR